VLSFRPANLLVVVFLAPACLGFGTNLEPGSLTPGLVPLYPPEPQPYETTVTLAAVGDIMMHIQQIDSGFLPEENRYDFNYFFDVLRPDLTKPDLLVGNLETTLSGKAAGYTGYPEFNAPDELAAALAAAGFDVLTTANNHALDRRERGVLHTLEVLDRHQILHTGTFNSPEARDQILLVEKNQISLAFLAYTYGTNGIPIPKGKEYLVNLIDPQVIEEDISRAKERGADVVVVALHFGDEYRRVPNNYQQQLADQVLRMGADIILGSHPHVVQPYELKKVITTDGTEKEGLVVYSLGNFISAQRGDYKDLGVIFQVELMKSFPEEKVTIKAVDYRPTYVDRYLENGKPHYQVTLLNQAKPGGTEEGTPVPKKFYADVTAHLESLMATPLAPGA